MIFICNGFDGLTRLEDFVVQLERDQGPQMTQIIFRDSVLLSTII